MTLAERALEHARAVSRWVDGTPPTGQTIQARASLAAAYASLAVADELAKFEAVAVEAREEHPKRCAFPECPCHPDRCQGITA